MLQNIDFDKLTTQYLRNALATSANLPIAWVFIESFQRVGSSKQRRTEVSHVQVDYMVGGVYVYCGRARVADWLGSAV
jgi:hypothetical protein